jgi:hypothetical protein
MRSKSHSLTLLRLSALSLALCLFMAIGQPVFAEDAVDPPRTQKAAGYTVEFLTPAPGGNHDAEIALPFRFRVTDAQGKPATNLNLNVTAIRDYSGQVKKEHNGPRTPPIGPRALKETEPGVYEASILFGFVGHWYIKVDGASFADNAFVRFRQPVGAAEGKGQGVGLDWLTWVGLVVVVLGLTAYFAPKKEANFPIPYDELEEPRPAPVGSSASEQSEAPAKQEVR